jgi:hypothetical protein
MYASRKAYQISSLLRCPSERVGYSTLRTDRSSAIFSKAFRPKDGHEVCMSGPRVQEEWEMVLLSQTQLETEAYLLSLNWGELQSVVVYKHMRQDR